MRGDTMGIRSFFHKVKVYFQRNAEKGVVPYVAENERYGKHGEDSLVYNLAHELTNCRVKRNVLITTDMGRAEIDCLVLYQNKLFAIEVKRWKGRVIERDGEFFKEKTDRWTGEYHVKARKSPFKQINRAIYLLRKQIPINAWVNSIVFFDDIDLESISITSQDVWFQDRQELIEYIQKEGRASRDAQTFFDKCISADYVYSNHWGNYLYCRIYPAYLCFNTPEKTVYAKDIVKITIEHHWWYDDLHILLTDGSIVSGQLENAVILVDDGGRTFRFAFCKLDHIVMGREK